MSVAFEPPAYLIFQTSCPRTSTVGSWADGKLRHGVGTMEWVPGARLEGFRTYEGHWQGDVVHGKGVMLWHNGDKWADGTHKLLPHPRTRLCPELLRAGAFPPQVRRLLGGRPD